MLGIGGLTSKVQNRASPVYVSTMERWYPNRGEMHIPVFLAKYGDTLKFQGFSIIYILATYGIGVIKTLEATIISILRKNT